MIYSHQKHTVSTFSYFLELFFLDFRFSAAVAYLLRGLTHFDFRNALLRTTVVMCGYLHYCHLPVSLDQSVKKKEKKGVEDATYQ